MKTYIIYFFTLLFLLFVVESKLNVKTLDNSFQGKISHSLPNFSHSSAKDFSKLSPQISISKDAALDLEITEDGFQLSDPAETLIVFASVFGLLYVFTFSVKKKADAFTFIHHFDLSVKKFILIRSIRL